MKIVGVCFFCNGAGNCGICQGSGVLPKGFIDKNHTVCECGQPSILYLNRHYCENCVVDSGLAESYMKIWGNSGRELQQKASLPVYAG